MDERERNSSHLDGNLSPSCFGEISGLFISRKHIYRRCTVLYCTVMYWSFWCGILEKDYTRAHLSLFLAMDFYCWCHHARHKKRQQPRNRQPTYGQLDIIEIWNRTHFSVNGLRDTVFSATKQYFGNCRTLLSGNSPGSWDGILLLFSSPISVLHPRNMTREDLRVVGTRYTGYRAGCAVWMFPLPSLTVKWWSLIIIYHNLS